MRLRTWSIVALLFLAIGTFEINAGVSNAHASTIQSDNAPKILDARVKGNKLILTGENFAEGSVILVDGEPQKTRNDEDNPSTILIAKKAGKFIPDNAVVTLQVQSANAFTTRFRFFKGQIITLDYVGKPITLRVGDKFLLFLQKGDYEFSPQVIDGTILRKTSDVEIAGSQGVFEALRLGNTKLTAIGDRPCRKTIPSCLAPTLYVEFTINVE